MAHDRVRNKEKNIRPLSGNGGAIARQGDHFPPPEGGGPKNHLGRRKRGQKNWGDGVCTSQFGRLAGKGEIRPTVRESDLKGT